jgi:hypothetical protein
LERRGIRAKNAGYESGDLSATLAAALSIET